MLLKNIFNNNKNKNVHPIIQKNNSYFRDFDRGLPLQKYEFVVLDTELTGLNRKSDEIVAIGAVKIKNLQICCSETFYLLVKPEENSPTDSTLIHKITPQQLKQAENIEEVLPRFIEFCGNDVLIGHYVGLDIGFINRSCQKVLGGLVHNPCLDTMRLAMAYKEIHNGRYYDHYSAMNTYNLASLAREYGLPEFEQHDALQDSLQTAYLFLYFIKKMRSNGLHTLKDFMKAGRQWKIIY